MNILKKYILPLLLPLFLTGCFSGFEPDIDTTPVLCMNSLLVPGEPVTVSLTRTWRWDEGSDYELDLTVKDADVSLYVNGEFRERLELREVEGNHTSYPSYPYNDPDRYEYAGTYCPVSGDVVRLVAVSETYGKATAEVTVPEPVAIDKVEYTVKKFVNLSDKDMERIEMSMDCMIWFTDPAESADYYQFKASLRNHYYSSGESGTGEWLHATCYIDYDREPLFTEHLSALEHVGAETSGYTFFSDRQISGKSYPIHLSVDDISYAYKNPGNDPEMPQPELAFTLQSLSRSYYSHILSVWVGNDGIVGALGSVGLGDAVFASSNVSTKAGVVAAYAPSTVTLSLREIATKAK